MHGGRAFLALALFVNGAIAQTVGAPDVRVGDEWKFAVYYTVPTTTPNRTWTITSVTEAGIEGTENGEPLRLTRELNVLESPRDKSPNFKLLAFPLAVGKRWHYVNDWLFKPTSSLGRSTVDAHVVAYEKIAVPAGDFDAFKIHSVEKLSGTSPAGNHLAGEITRTYWYAPAARAIVKSVWHDPYIGTTTLQLVDFRSTPAPPAAPMTIPLEVMKPDGEGPFPAIVMLHDCSGLGPRSSGSPRRWARKLVEWGYVVAIPDSFSTRGHPNGVCTSSSPDRFEVGPVRRVRDAYETLRHLRTLPYVDAARIGAMGGSHGGATTLATMAEVPQDSPSMTQQKRQGFRAAVALYPSCSIGQPRFDTQYKAVAPVLILSAELDDWTPAQPCQRLAEAARKDGADVRIKVYAGAHHSFDSNSPVRYVPTRNNANAPGGSGATTGGNAEAWADSIREVKEFFTTHL